MLLKYSIRQLQYFVVAGQTCSVTKAAEILNVSQPSVSAAIVHLEAVFDVQLFVRHHAKGLSLTNSGAKILGQAKLLIKQAEELNNSAQEFSNSISGTLDIGCYAILAPVIVPSLIKEFNRTYQNVHINCHETDLDDLYTGLQSGKFDLALAYKLDIPDNIVFQPLAYYKPYILIPSNHRLAAKKKIALKELSKEPMILLDLPHSRQYFESIFTQSAIKPTIEYRSTSPYLVHTMVANGLGYSIMNIPTGINHALDGTEFKKVPLKDKLDPLIMGAIILKNIKLTKTTRTFLEHCKKTWAD